MKKLFSIVFVCSMPCAALAQGFVGVSVAALQSKPRPEGVELSEWVDLGVNYYVETIDSVHTALYYVTSFAKTGVCTGYGYLAPVAEKAALTDWLKRFYIRKNATTWRSHSGILLTLVVEDDKVRLMEEKPAPVSKK